MSEDKYKKALNNCLTDAVQLRKRIASIEDTLQKAEQDVEKAKKALKNCLSDAVNLRKKSPAMRVRRSRRSRRCSRK